MSDVATTIRLPKELYESLRRYAFENRRSIAAVVRTAVRRELSVPGEEDADSTAPPTRFEDDPLHAIVGVLHSGPADESAELDHYLYGSRKRRST